MGDIATLQVRLVLAFVAVLWLLLCRSYCRLIVGTVLVSPSQSESPAKAPAGIIAEAIENS